MHAEACDPWLQEMMKEIKKNTLKSFDYGKVTTYPKFKIQMHFEDFNKNKNFIYEMVGKETDKYNMSEEDKQDFVLSRMLSNEAKSKLKSIGINRENLKNDLEELLKDMEKHLVKKEKSINLVHGIIKNEDDYSLAKQTKINDDIGSMCNVLSRNKEWKTFLDKPRMKVIE